MSVEIFGEEELGKAFDGLVKGVSKEVSDALLDGGKVVRAAAISSISEGSPQGRSYKKKSGEIHRASAPGQAPASDEGRLTDKIAVKQTEKGVFVGSNLKYARYLELGTQDIKARPWLVPALESSKRTIDALVSKAINETIKRRTK